MSEFLPSAHTVLVVDSNRAHCIETAALLERVGYRIRTYQSAEDLLEEIEDFDMHACVISEMNLPGMNGLELTQEMRERGLSMPILILTRHSDVATAVTALRSSVADYLMKPFIERDLVNRVRAVLTRHSEFGDSAG